MTVTPETVLEFWIGEASTSADALEAKNRLWFQKNFETDRHIAETFTSTLANLAAGLAHDWAKQGPRGRLAAIIALDQFSRNIFRGHRFSFKHDDLALQLTEDGLAKGEDRTLSEAERVFFYLPLEHAEDMDAQTRCVELFEKLAAEGRPDFKPFCETTLDFARKHMEVIGQFGRFPHRNQILRRPSTREEKAYLAQPGAGF